VQAPVQPGVLLQPEEPVAAQPPAAVLPQEREPVQERRFDCTQPANSPLRRWQGYSV